MKYLDFVREKLNLDYWPSNYFEGLLVYMRFLDLCIWGQTSSKCVFFVGSSKWPCHVGSMTSHKILLMQGCLNSYHYDYIGSRFLCAQDQNLCLNFAGSWEKDVFRLLSLFLSFFSIISYPHPPSPFISCIKYFFKHKCICREEIEISFFFKKKVTATSGIWYIPYVVAKRIDIYIKINKN